jgi:hypothetical protein
LVKNDVRPRHTAQRFDWLDFRALCTHDVKHGARFWGEAAQSEMRFLLHFSLKKRQYYQQKNIHG